MQNEPLIEKLKRRYAELQAKRSTFNSTYTDLQRFVLPEAAPFTQGGSSLTGEQTYKEIFDSTAAYAAEQFANGLHSSATSPTERWFQISLAGENNPRLSRRVLIWLEEVSDIIYHHYSLPDANHGSALQESYLQLGVFGTDCIYQDWDIENNCLSFRAVSLGDIYIDEAANGLIDTVFRVRSMTKRQLLQEFPDIENHDKVKNERPERTYEVVHSCFPRSDSKIGLLSTQKRFASIYWAPELKEILSESGYDTFPYHVSRWRKQTGEVWGRGPGMVVLPSIKMLNQMEKELIVSAQIANNPPIIAENDSLLPAVTGKLSFAPRSIIYKEQGTEFPQPFVSGSQPQLTLELMDAERTRILQAFYVDYLIRQKKKERQSVTEILDERGEMLRQMAPMLARIQTEKLGPMLVRSFSLLSQHRQLPPPPAEISNRMLKITYISPAAKAQLGAKGIQISAFLQDITQWANIDPSVFEVLDTEEVIRQLADARDISRKILKDPELLAQERAQKAEAQQMQMAAEIAPQIGQTMKDVAQARQADPNILGGL